MKGININQGNNMVIFIPYLSPVQTILLVIVNPAVLTQNTSCFERPSGRPRRGELRKLSSHTLVRSGCPAQTVSTLTSPITPVL